VDRQTERQTDRQRVKRTYMTNLIVTFRKFANASKNIVNLSKEGKNITFITKLHVVTFFPCGTAAKRGP